MIVSQYFDRGTGNIVGNPGDVTYLGQPGHYYTSNCRPGNIFVPITSPKDLSLIAYDEVVRKLTIPAPVFAPPLSKGGYVNLTSWIGVQAVQAVTADAAVPGLGVRTTATADHVEWDPGDGSTVVCDDLGAFYVPNGPTVPVCGWTPKQPSAPQFTGTRDLQYHGSFRLVWNITWVSTGGDGGELGNAVTHTDTAYKVREIQTIGDG